MDLESDNVPEGLDYEGLGGPALQTDVGAMGDFDIRFTAFDE